MGSLSITAACSGILEAIGPLVLKARDFAVGMREARKEMTMLVQELSSLSILLDSLRNEYKDPSSHYPQNLRQSFVEVLGGCAGIVSEIGIVLDKSATGSRRQTVQWKASGRDGMKKLRERLTLYSKLIDTNLELLPLYVQLHIL